MFGLEHDLRTNGWEARSKQSRREGLGLVVHNAKVEAGKQKLHLGDCSRQETTVEYRKAWRIGMGACRRAIGDHRNNKQMRHATFQRGGGAGFWKWSCNGEGEGGIFRFVSHGVKTDIVGKGKQSTEGTMRQSTFKFKENVTRSRARSQMSCFWK